MDAALARSPAPADFRVSARLAAFIAGSIALHALTIGAYVPGSGGDAATPAPAPGTVLHAVLAPAPLAQSPDQAADSRSGSRKARIDARAATRDAGPGDAATIPLPDKWYTASELDVRAEPLTREKLDYPAELGPLGPSGNVRVKLFIDERGIVRKAQIARSGPEAAFDRAALEAFRDVRFSPALKAGIAVKSQKLLELDFTPEVTLR